MAKYHINKKGLVAVCKAKKGSCPLGGDGIHFNSERDANKYVERKFISEHGLIPTVNSDDFLMAKIKSMDNYRQYEILRDADKELKIEAIKENICLEMLMRDKDPLITMMAKEQWTKTPDGKLYKLHEDLVPLMGKSNNIAGEIIRAFSRLNYKFYNNENRDKIGICDSSLVYLKNTFFNLDANSEIIDNINNLWDVDSKEEYENTLNKMTPLIYSYIEDNPRLKTKANLVNSRVDYKNTKGNKINIMFTNN